MKAGPLYVPLRKLISEVLMMAQIKGSAILTCPSPWVGGLKGNAHFFPTDLFQVSKGYPYQVFHILNNGEYPTNWILWHINYLKA